MFLEDLLACLEPLLVLLRFVVSLQSAQNKENLKRGKGGRYEDLAEQRLLLGSQYVLLLWRHFSLSIIPLQSQLTAGLS
jgi:hypothetical protein